MGAGYSSSLAANFGGLARPHSRLLWLEGRALLQKQPKLGTKLLQEDVPGMRCGKDNQNTSAL